MSKPLDPQKKPPKQQDDMLRRLSAGVVHEIKNPLTAIDSLIQLLEKRMDDPAQKKLARTILSEIQRLNHFLAEFLQYSKTPELTLKTINIRTLIENALTFSIDPGIDSKIKVQIDIPDTIPAVLVDPAAFHQVLLNVFNNATQAMNSKGVLQIQARFSKNHLNIQIRDSGPGIPPEQLDRIFEPYFSTKRGGTGLGLAISQQIITRHRGKIYFKRNKDQGMTLFIELPQKQNQSSTSTNNP